MYRIKDRYLIHQLNNTAMTTTMNQIITEKAVELTIMDAIAKGHTNPSELAAYMKSNIFKTACANYKRLLRDLSQ